MGGADFDIITTKTGDKGTAADYTGSRHPKEHILFELLGTLDELSSHLGMLKALCRERSVKHVTDMTEEIQKNLQRIMSRIASGPDAPTLKNIITDREIDAAVENLELFQKKLLDSGIEIPRSFILPGATLPSAQADICRTITRRSERLINRFIRTEHRELLRPAAVYMNRLSDVLYSCARYIEQKS